MADPGPLARALARLARLGFRRSLQARDGALRDVETGASFAPESLLIAETVRFEGDSDPDEQAAVFALRRAGGGPLGTWTVAFGPAMPAEDAAIVRRLRTERERAARADAARGG